jgi:hypothetical protein
MIRLLADNNAEGHVEVLVRVLSGESWIAFWNELGLKLVTFEECGLDRSLNDAELWRFCQREGIVLITNNRNAHGADSLEMVVRQENQPDSIPVFTLANPERVLTDGDYAEKTAVRLLDYLLYLEGTRGTGRLFVP